MKAPVIRIPTLLCRRCTHEWQPRREQLPRICPKCKSPLWQVPPRTHAERLRFWAHERKALGLPPKKGRL
jgi:hypothetical protein